MLIKKYLDEGVGRHTDAEIDGLLGKLESSGDDGLEVRLVHVLPETWEHRPVSAQLGPSLHSTRQTPPQKKLPKRVRSVSLSIEDI